jgi:hypothetical protein
LADEKSGPTEEPFVTAETSESTEPAEESARAREEVEPVEEEPSKDAQAPEEEDKLVKVVEHVRAESRQVRLTDPVVFLREPFGYTDNELAEVFAEMDEDENASDIVRTRDGRSGTSYLHSEALVSVPYAKRMLRKQADDPVYLIVETVREESQVYPRAVSIRTFELQPFSLSAEEAAAGVKALLESEDYEDIKAFETSNGVTYLYSERYLNGVIARSDAEWVEVEQFKPGNE